MFRKLIGAFVGLAMMGMASNAHAILISWTLSGVIFDDASPITGSFDFDADTTTYSSVNITTSVATYETSGVGPPGFGFSASTLSLVTPSFDLLVISFLAPLSNAGGAVPIFPPGFPASFEGICTDATCFTGGVTRSIVGGTVTGVVATPAPEPSTLALFATGLALLGLIGWRQRRVVRVKAA